MVNLIYKPFAHPNLNGDYALQVDNNIVGIVGWRYELKDYYTFYSLVKRFNKYNYKLFDTLEDLKQYFEDELKGGNI